MIANPTKAVIDILKADSSITALVSTRVFGIELPQDEAKNMPRKAIVIQPSGGGTFPVGSNDFVEHSTLRFDAFCYGETPFEAEKVRREVYDVLKQLKRTVINTVLIHWINSAGGLISLRDPETHWPVMFQSHQMFFAERAVT